MISVRFVSVPVSNQDRAVEFYTKKLGFEVVRDEPMGSNERWIEVKPPNSEIVIVLYPGSNDRIGELQGIGFTSDDVQKSYEELRNRGVEFVEPAARASWGGMQAVFKDVDGNRFVISNPGQ